MTACGGNLIGSEVKMKEQSSTAGSCGYKVCGRETRVPCGFFDQLPVER